MRNIWITVFLILAGASSTYLPQAGGTESERTHGSSGDDELHQASKPIDDPITMLQYFLHPLSPAKTNVILRGCEEPAAADDVYFEPPLQFKIATLPDPDRTHLSLYFDRWLASILEAAHDADYRFIGYWLPWSPDLPKTDLRPDDQAKVDEDSERRSTQPGMLLFRRPDHKSALVFFLVGETPTGGINRRQFANAACYIAELSGGASPKVVDVLGPQFSGSVSSFQEAILHDLPSAVQIGNVVSGVMSGEPALSRMRAASHLRSGKTFTFQHDTSYLGAAAQRARQVLDIKGKMAVLAEGGTDYGSAVGYAAKTEPDDSLTIYYPREISRLRNSYPEQSYATNAVARSSGIPDIGLTLRLHDVRTGTDTVPQFSEQTPVTQEATMLQITRTLTRENVSLAVIGGTDVLDLLFISRFMRNNCPDIRLMIYASDVLFVHGLDTLDFTGMLALSTYPLFSDNLRWSGRRQTNQTVDASTRRFFSSYTAEGIYNATLSLLESKESVREFSGTMDPSGGTNAPPAWLTVIGRDGYWPVGILLPVSDPMLPGHDPFIADVPGGIVRLEPAIPTRAWKALFCLLSAAAAFYAAIFVYAIRVRDARNHPLPRWCCAMHPEPLGLVSRRAHYSFVLSVTILLAYLTMVIAPFRLAAAGGGRSWTLMCTSAVIVTSLLLAVSFYGARWCRKRAIVFIALAALLTATAYGSLLFRGSFRNFLEPVEQSAMALFRAIRSVQIDSGVAPNAPLFLVCVAFSWWAWVQIRRFILHGELYQTPPPPPEGCSKSLADLDRWLAHGFLHIDEFGWLLLGSALTTILLISEGAAGTVESAQFSHLLCILIAFLGALLFLTAYCVLRIWFVLHRLLNALDDNPIREAFSAMPQEVSWAQVWSHGVISPSYKAVVATVESFRALRDFDRSYYPGLEDDVNRLQIASETILRRANSGEREELSEIKEYQAVSGKITTELSDQLAKRGWRAAVSGTLEKLAKTQADGTMEKGVVRWLGVQAEVEVQSSPSDPADKADQLAAEIVALRYAAYIRYVMRHLRNLIEFLTYGFILSALAVNSYPFQALTVIRWSVTLVSLPLGGVVVYLFMKMSRDAILSRLSSTEGGRLNRDFYARFLSTGALPLLTVVGSHFPSVGRFLLSWVQPAISAVH